MQTEISFLLDLILDEELSPKVQKLCRKRVRELESGIVPSRPTTNFNQKIVTENIAHGAPQAPSTLRALEGATGAPIPLLARPAIIPAEMDKETGRAMVSTGGGTKGPRKF